MLRMIVMSIRIGEQVPHMLTQGVIDDQPSFNRPFTQGLGLFE